MRKLSSILLLTITMLTVSIPALAQEAQRPRLITVTGDAEVRVVPDEVILNLGVETWSKDLKAAKTENDQRVQKILQLAKTFGIESKHVQTDYISIEPRYEDQWEHRNFIGYFVRKTVAITLRDTSRFEALLSRALEAGADYVHGVQFRTTDLRKHRDQARALAIKAAREKAIDLAISSQPAGEPFPTDCGSSGGGIGSRGRLSIGSARSNLARGASRRKRRKITTWKMT